MNPAALLALACTGLAGIALLLAGLLQPDHPLPPIRTAADQTPVSTPLHILATSTHIPPTKMAFQPVSTPKSTFYVSARAYGLLSACGLYEASMPESSISRQDVGMYPVPNCSVAPIGH